MRQQAIEELSPFRQRHGACSPFALMTNSCDQRYLELWQKLVNTIGLTGECIGADFEKIEITGIQFQGGMEALRRVNRADNV